jgi:hypothetical protein
MDIGSSRILIHDYLDPDVFGRNRPRTFDMLDLHLVASMNRPSRSEVEWDDLIESTGGQLQRRKTWMGKDGSVILELLRVK